MRRVSITIVAAVSTIAFAQFASAADLPRKAPVAVPPPPPVYSWTGFYAGLNAGGSWGNTTIDNSASVNFCSGIVPAFCPASAATLPGQFDPHLTGFIGGGQIGYNYQFASNWVAGLEADFQGADIKGDASGTNTTVVPGFPTNPLTIAGTGSQKIDWFGTLRGRVGWLPVNSLLVYATGGLAYGHVQTDVSFSEHIEQGANPFDGSTAISQSDTRVGWTVGGGLEWMFAPRWSVKGEYLYYDLGTVTFNQTLGVAAVGIPRIGMAIQSDAHYKGNIVRAGVNYKFY